MTILVMSDSHGRDDLMERIVSTHPGADMYIFLGDGLRDAEKVFENHPGVPNVTVCGNCDWFSHNALPLVTLDMEGVKISVCHGHNFSVKSGLGVYRDYAQERGISLALFGHTHTPCELNYDEVLMFNPGAVCDGSYGIVHIEKGGVLVSHGNLEL